MRVGLGQLKGLLEKNVCEVVFTRRLPILNRPPTRRMLCTNSLELLMSPDGRTTLNFSPAHRQPKYNPAAKGLIITWDIFMQDYRQINVRSCDLVNKVPVAEFWEYYRAKLASLTASQKMEFMDI